MKRLLVLFSIFLFISNQSFAAPIVAEVIKLKGKVTVLFPGKHDAQELFEKDKLPEGSSILTYDKSFARVKFIDGSIMNLGPKSKIFIEKINKQESGILNLLVGQIRTKVIKEANKDNDGLSPNKLIVKTRTAALGVRGTEFQTIYNPENFATSLLTFDGKVAMAKLDRKVDEIKEVAKIEEVLATNEVVEVSPGRYAGVVDSLNRPTLPVKISPVQFNALKKSDAIAPIKKTTKQIAEEEKIITTDEPPAEGSFDEKTQEYAPTAGGYLDPTTGIYIAPSINDKFDPKHRVFIPSKKVGVIEKNGNYRPPKGLELDSVKGFVLSKNIDNIEVNKKDLLAIQDHLNQKVAIYKPILDDPAPVIVKIGKEERRKKSAPFKFKVSLDMDLMKEDLAYTSTSSKSNLDMESRLGGRILAEYIFRHKNFGLFVGVGISTLDYQTEVGLFIPNQTKNSLSLTQGKDARTLLYRRLGFKYYPSSKGVFTTTFIKDDQTFISLSDSDIFNTNTHLHLTKKPTEKINLSFEQEFYKEKSLFVNFRFHTLFLNSDNKNYADYKKGFGVGAKFAVGKRYKTFEYSFKLWKEHERQKVIHRYYQTSEYMLKRDMMGAGIFIARQF